MNHPCITCYRLGHIDREAVPENMLLAPGEVHVWLGEVSDELTGTERSIHPLSAPELDKQRRYHRQIDGLRYKARRGSLRQILSFYLGQPADEIQFELGENKKPVTAGNIHFNVSHSEDRFLIAVAASALGTDLERINRHFDFSEIVANHFSPEERDFITHSKDPAATFYSCWTCKEALVKATSKGITDDLKYTPGYPGTHHVNAEILGASGDWWVAGFDAGNEYYGSVAFGQQLSPRFFTIQ